MDFDPHIAQIQRGLNTSDSAADDQYVFQIMAPCPLVWISDYSGVQTWFLAEIRFVFPYEAVALQLFINFSCIFCIYYLNYNRVEISHQNIISENQGLLERLSSL